MSKGRPEQAKGDLKSDGREVAFGAAETTSYFQMPGYYYQGYDYDGMFAWFDIQKPHISLLLRPPTIRNHKKELADYSATKATVHLPLNGKVPSPFGLPMKPGGTMFHFC